MPLSDLDTSYREGGGDQEPRLSSPCRHGLRSRPVFPAEHRDVHAGVYLLRSVMCVGT